MNITGRKDVGATSRFEVYVNNVLVHSKIERGMGFVDTEEKKATIVFDNAGEKKLLLKFAKLQLLS